MHGKTKNTIPLYTTHGPEEASRRPYNSLVPGWTTRGQQHKEGSIRPCPHRLSKRLVTVVVVLVLVLVLVVLVVVTAAVAVAGRMAGWLAGWLAGGSQPAGRPADKCI